MSSFFKISRMRFGIGIVWILMSALSVSAALGSLNSEQVYMAASTKKNHYIQDGLVIGGDRAISDVIVLDIRHAKNREFERIVIDLEGNRQGEPAAIERPPYYQVAITPDMNRLVFTIWGNPKLAFDARRVLKAFHKSGLIQTVQLLPVLEKDRWNFILELRKRRPVEIFELSNPVRLIVDLKAQ